MARLRVSAGLCACPLWLSVYMVCVWVSGPLACSWPPSQHGAASGLGGGELVSHTRWGPREAGGGEGTETAQLA